MPHRNRIRVLVVDDSRLMQSLLGELLASDPDIDFLGAASDPFEAREKIKQLNPDIITLDIEMPKMDGLTFLEKIMTLRPMPVLMISTLTARGAEATLRALEIGAVDYLTKPGAGEEQQLMQLRDELLLKIKTAARARLSGAQRAEKRKAHQTPPERLTLSGPSHLDLIAIGASTGGVEALREVLTVLPDTLPPIVITQHMPEHFTQSFARRLNSLCALTVCEATHGQHLLPGHAYIAPGNRHLEVRRAARGGCQAMLVDGPQVSGHRPSVDVLFQSVAETVGAKAVGVILTGMGKDGAQGLWALRQTGAPTIGEDESTCVVYGMPRAAAALGAVVEELPLQAIPARLVELCEARSTNRKTSGARHG